MGYGICVAIAALGPYPSSFVPAAAIGCLNLVFGAALDGLVIFQQVRFELGRVSSVSIGSRIIFVALVTALYLAGSASLSLYVLATLSATALPFAALLFHIRRSIALRPVVDLPRWRRWIVDCVPIALAFALGTLYFRIDALLLLVAGRRPRSGSLRCRVQVRRRARDRVERPAGHGVRAFRS